MKALPLKFTASEYLGCKGDSCKGLFQQLSVPRTAKAASQPPRIYPDNVSTAARSFFAGQGCVKVTQASRGKGLGGYMVASRPVAIHAVVLCAHCSRNKWQALLLLLHHFFVLSGCCACTVQPWALFERALTSDLAKTCAVALLP